jgi:hypothetical protein
MTEPIFYPMPEARRRGIGRWVLLALHALPFAVVVFAYPTLEELYPDIFATNAARILIPCWAGVMIFHVLLAALLDVREGTRVARRERERREQFIRQHRRQQFASRIRGEGDPETET